MKNSIVVKNLTKSYKLYGRSMDRLKESLSVTGRVYHRDFRANDDISFSVKRGEVVGIIGRNGCGKSTLLKMITGVLSPTSGLIRVRGKITALLELGAGFNVEMSGLENLYLSGAISGYSQEEMKSKVDEIVEFAEIGEFIHQPLKTYSSGMKARLGFGFAIHTEPEILIIDEALSVGDAAFQRKCYARIEYMCEAEDITVLFVSHSGGVIKQLCSRAILLSDGGLVIDGEPKKVVNLYEKFMSGGKTDIQKIRQEYEKMVSEEKKETKKVVLNSYFNPNLKSKSLVEFRENGARIFDIKLLDETKSVVNIIEKHRVYTYTYMVKFSQEYESVRFAMRVKDTKGIVVSGHVMDIDSIKKDREYAVSFEFTNILNSGDYFCNAGVNSTIYGDTVKLHRIIDGYMFRVVDEDKGARGIVDMRFDFDIKSS